MDIAHIEYSTCTVPMNRSHTMPLPGVTPIPEADCNGPTHRLFAVGIAVHVLSDRFEVDYSPGGKRAPEVPDGQAGYRPQIGFLPAAPIELAEMARLSRGRGGFVTRVLARCKTLAGTTAESCCTDVIGEFALSAQPMSDKIDCAYAFFDYIQGLRTDLACTPDRYRLQAARPFSS